MLGSLASRRVAALAPAAPSQSEPNRVAQGSLVKGEISVGAAAQILEVAEIRADFLGHGAQQADVQLSRHGFVKLGQP